MYRLTAEGRRVEPVLRSIARFGAQYLSGEPTEVFDAERVAFSLLAPWRRRPEVKMRGRLIAVHDNGQEETVDLVLDLAGMQIDAPDGKADVTLRVTITELVKARQTGGALVGQLSGNPAARRNFLDQFGLRMAKP